MGSYILRILLWSKKYQVRFFFLNFLNYKIIAEVFTRRFVVMLKVVQRATGIKRLPIVLRFAGRLSDGCTIDTFPNTYEST
jgi:hypothetical protein